MRYIDKDAIINEIKRRMNIFQLSSDDERDQSRNDELFSLLCYIESLKEISPISKIDYNKLDSMLDEALKYFLKRQKESCNKRLDLNQCIEIRKECCPFRCESTKGPACKRYVGDILDCDGNCSWVVDYHRLKEIYNRKQKFQQYKCINSKLANFTYGKIYKVFTDDQNKRWITDDTGHSYIFGYFDICDFKLIEDSKEKIIEETVEGKIVTIHEPDTGDEYLDVIMPIPMCFESGDKVEITIKKKK